jgi:glycerophosphoryl diester phosphodiesterase
LFDLKFKELTAHRGRPLILGHRGSPTRAKENTLDSYRIALETGADGIELDVQCTSDGVLVAHHDDFLPAGEILKAMPYAKLLPLAKRAECELPTLREVFTLVAGRGLLNIELKGTGYEATTIQLAREILPFGTFAFSSFDLRAVLQCRKLAPDVPAFLIVWGERDAAADLQVMREIDASGIAFESHYLSDNQAEFFRSHGYPIFVWTVNDPEEAARLAAMDVAGIITDLPAEMVAFFNSLR